VHRGHDNGPIDTDALVRNKFAMPTGLFYTEIIKSYECQERKGRMDMHWAHLHVILHFWHERRHLKHFLNLARTLAVPKSVITHTDMYDVVHQYRATPHDNGEGDEDVRQMADIFVETLRELDDPLPPLPPPKKYW